MDQKQLLEGAPQGEGQDKATDVGFIIMDVQENAMNPWHNSTKEKEELVNSISAAKDFCYQTGHPVIYVEIPGRGNTIEELLSADERNRVMRFGKNHNSVFTESGTFYQPRSKPIQCTFDYVLQNLGLRRLVFSGINGSACVPSSMLGALLKKGRGYKVITAPKLIANNSPDLDDRETMLDLHQTYEWIAEDWIDAFAKVLSPDYKHSIVLPEGGTK